MIHQLRTYEIFEHNKAAFHARLRDHAMRFMQRHGFQLLATWETRTAERTEFIYLLAWPDEATMLRTPARLAPMAARMDSRSFCPCIARPP